MSVYMDTLRAVAQGDSEEAARLDGMISDADRPHFNTCVTAVFGLLLAERFDENATHDDVMRFVNELKYGYRDLEPPLKPLAVEATIRGTLGEEALLDEVDLEEQVRVMLMVIRAITAVNERVQLHLDGFLSDAEMLVQRL